MNSIPDMNGSRFEVLPVERLSRARTSSPRRTSSSTMFEPMKPAAPVTRYFDTRSSPSRYIVCSCRLFFLVVIDLQQLTAADPVGTRHYNAIGQYNTRRHNASQ